MEITFELVFAVVTALTTAILGTFFKDRLVPSRLIPLQNLVIGILAAVIAVYFKLFTDIPTAILISLALSLGVGGTYDLVQTKSDKNK